MKAMFVGSAVMRERFAEPALTESVTQTTAPSYATESLRKQVGIALCQTYTILQFEVYLQQYEEIMQQVNDKLDFDVDTPSDKELKKKFEKEERERMEKEMLENQGRMQDALMKAMRE